MFLAYYATANFDFTFCIKSGPPQKVGHKESLHSTIDWILSLKSGSTRKLPCLSGWLMTIRSILFLWVDLRDNHQAKCLLTNCLNQDCVENLFSVIIGKGVTATILHLNNSDSTFARLRLSNVFSRRQGSFYRWTKSAVDSVFVSTNNLKATLLYTGECKMRDYAVGLFVNIRLHAFLRNNNHKFTPSRRGRNRKLLKCAHL